MVELHGSSEAIHSLRAPVESSGRFQFDAVEPGQYELRLVDPYGAVIARDIVLIAEFAPPLIVRLPRPEAAPRRNGVVSVRQLRGRTSRTAVKEFSRAAKASHKSDGAGAIRHLQRAIALAPEFLEAHNNLGVQYLAAGRTSDAVEQFRTALGLNPQSAITQANLALALYTRGELKGAEAAAHEATSLQPDLLPAQYALALIFEAQGRNKVEALRLLAGIAGRFPQARMVRARILARNGQFTAAAAEIRSYLADAKPGDREQAQNWLEKLQRVTPPAVPSTGETR